MNDPDVHARPIWCPDLTCKFRLQSQDQLCVGELSSPEDHAGVDNTHRICIRGAEDDGSWVFPLKINKGDAWNITRLLKHLFWREDN